MYRPAKYILAHTDMLDRFPYANYVTYHACALFSILVVDVLVKVKLMLYASLTSL
jgi:hypothetical protein